MIRQPSVRQEHKRSAGDFLSTSNSEAFFSKTEPFFYSHVYVLFFFYLMTSAQFLGRGVCRLFNACFLHLGVHFCKKYVGLTRIKA